MSDDITSKRYIKHPFHTLGDIITKYTPNTIHYLRRMRPHGGVSMVDFIPVILFAHLMSDTFEEFILCVILLTLIGSYIHALLGINTTINGWLGLNKKP